MEQPRGAGDAGDRQLAKTLVGSARCDIKGCGGPRGNEMPRGRSQGTDSTVYCYGHVGRKEGRKEGRRQRVGWAAARELPSIINQSQ